MAYLTDVMGTGLLKPPSTSVTSSVQQATASPIEASRLGTTAPSVPIAPTNTATTDRLTALNSATANTITLNQQAAPTQPVAAQPAPEPTGLQKTLQDILGIGTQLEERGQATFDIQTQEGVFDKKERAKQLENDILSRSQAYEKQIREAMKNPDGKLIGGLQAQVNDLQRQSAEEIADLSIAYKIAQDDYRGAFEIAQAKVEAQFAPLEQRLETLKTYYQLAQNDMTESQKMQAQQKIREEESRIDFERQKEMALYRTQLEQADPLYQAQLAKARERSVTLAPTDVIEQDGRKLLINTQTGQIIKDFSGNTTAGTTGEMKTALAKSFVDTVDSLKTDSGMTRAVGAYGISRFTPFTPDKSAVNSFISSVNQMTSTLTLNNLIDAKARGATFGALSIPELNMLAASATKISEWARNEDGKKVNPETDLVHHYEVSEAEFKKELDKISNFGKLDYILKGGKPEDVGVIRMNNGSYAVKNSDGTVTVIRE
jgi:hypothetical protein